MAKAKRRTDPDALLKKYAKADVTIERDGNFTIAIVRYKRRVFVGVAKKSPADPMVQERGESIARIRALRKLERSAE